MSPWKRDYDDDDDDNGDDDDYCVGGGLFNEAFDSSYSRASNWGRISEKLTANNMEGTGRGLN